jgi:hypothetical protein
MEGLMQEAGYGRGSDYTKDKKVRGDKFIWLTQMIDQDDNPFTKHIQANK